MALVELSVYAQTNAAAPSRNKPIRLNLQPAARKALSRYRKQLPPKTYMLEGFYPIGWSKDGKFAYYLEPVDEACHCYFAKLFILDLKTDKVLWSFDYNSEFIDEAQKEGRPYTLEALWRANWKLFSERLREHRIQARGRFALLSFPVSYRGDRFTANLTTREKPGLTEEQRWYGTVGQTTLQLSSRRYGRKTVLDHSHSEALPLHVGLVGFLKSPFEPRIALVLLDIIRGYEGPPHTARVRIVGAALQSGFK